ncbi:MAG: metallophosphoesterase [Bacteroidales bacterium]|nr:metallophosphoesterase [Bacteroidales bacterium]
MKIIALADLHGKMDMIPRFGPVLVTADLVILTGDITHFGHYVEMQQVIKAVCEFNSSVFAVSGNCDYSDGEAFLVESGMNINGCLRDFQGLFFAGLSGSLSCPGKTPQEYSEQEYGAKLELLSQKIRQPFILVSHQPPRRTINDRVFPGMHVGSKTIRKFIEAYEPCACFTGHIHEGIGIDTIGKTKIINPGPAKDGNYAALTIENGKIFELRADRI